LADQLQTFGGGLALTGAFEKLRCHMKPSTGLVVRDGSADLIEYFPHQGGEQLG
jgi:hypothetical protein